ncbi:MAG: DEAD/DEAH box helicase family protein [Thermoplasmatales archaeon]
MSLQNHTIMPDSFVHYEEDFKHWMMSGYPDAKSETIEFIEHLFHRSEGTQIWTHQEEAILRVIYSYEIRQNDLGNKYLLRIVTGGGKSLIIASIIAWLKFAYADEFDKLLLICPNLIVKDRLTSDFVRSQDNNNTTVFEKWSLTPDDGLNSRISATVLESGTGPQGILTADIVITNIQELYASGQNTARNLDFLVTKVSGIAVFNDEAHNSVADEFTRVLKILESKTLLRLDTTATPERADGSYPNSKLIYSFDITAAMDSPRPIIKNIVVLQPESRIVELTYTNTETREKRKITDFTPDEMEQYEKRIKPFQWIMDPAPMRMLLSISINALDQKRKEAKGEYKPLLFVVTMGIEEAKRAKEFLESEFGLKTLLVTEESDYKDREEAKKIGSFSSPYQAVVSVFMLREGWDVAQVSVVLLLRKISSPVFGQQIIGRGLRKIKKSSPDPEVLFVVDHPKLDHNWLWKLMNVSRVRQDILPTDEIVEEELPPRTKFIQKLVDPSKLIMVKQPSIDASFQAKLEEIRNKVKDNEVVTNWRKVIDSTTYDTSESIEITAVSMDRIRKRSLGKRFGVEVEDKGRGQLFTGSSNNNFSVSDATKEIITMVRELIEENGYDITKQVKLYNIVMDHVCDKFLSGRSLSSASKEDLETIIKFVPEIKKTFTKGILEGIFRGGN